MDAYSASAINQMFILAGLTPRQIHYMSDYVKGRTLTEIAQKNGVSLSAVSRTVTAAKRKLNSLYGKTAIIPGGDVVWHGKI